MTPEIYVTDSERTLAKFPDGIGMDVNTAEELGDLLTKLIVSCRLLDGYKKEIYYGKEFDPDQLHKQCVKQFQLTDSQVENLEKLDERETNLLHAAIGKLTEAGEVLENVFAYVSSPDQNYDPVNTVEEVGDGFWYDAILLRDAGISMTHCMEKNINKLRVRYPDKFDNTHALNRNLEEERKTIED